MFLPLNRLLSANADSNEASHRVIHDHARSTQKGLDELEGIVGALLKLPLEAESRALAEGLRRRIRDLRTRG